MRRKATEPSKLSKSQNQLGTFRASEWFLRLFPKNALNERQSKMNGDWTVAQQHMREQEIYHY